MLRVEGELAERVELRDESFVQRAVQRADASGARSRVREREALAADIAHSSAERKRVDGRSLHDRSTGSSCVRTISTQSTPWCQFSLEAHDAGAHRLHGEMGGQRGAAAARVAADDGVRVHCTGRPSTPSPYAHGGTPACSRILEYPSCVTVRVSLPGLLELAISGGVGA
jgi:hypothetical protein